MKNYKLKLKGNPEENITDLEIVFEAIDSVHATFIAYGYFIEGYTMPSDKQFKAYELLKGKYKNQQIIVTEI